MTIKISFKSLEKEYTKLLKQYTIKKNYKGSITRASNSILKNKDRYQYIERATGVPWAMVAVIHKMETGLKFSRHLHNGDSLKKRTRRVPANRPTKGKPPFTWEESAIDAIRYMKLDKVSDWSLERMCYELERYNGWGYRKYHKKVKSPYLWSGTTNYISGKYVSDGKWSSSTVSKQLGAIPVLLSLMKETNSLPETNIVKSSKKLSLLKKINNFIKFSVTTLLGLFTMDTFELASGFIGDLTIMMKSNSVLIVAGVLILGWLVSNYLKKKTIEDYKDGRYTPSEVNK